MQWVIRRNKVKVLVVVAIVLIFILYTKVNEETKVKIPHIAKSVEFLSLPETSYNHHKVWKNIYVSAHAEKHKHDRDIVDIGIATQCSISHLDKIIQLTKAWKGPISIGVMVLGIQWNEYIGKVKELILCHDDIARYVTFHALIPLSHPPEEDVLRFSINKTEVCDRSMKSENVKTGSMNYDNAMISYPVNALRNIAVKNMMTSHVLVLDVDMIPSSGLRKFLMDRVLHEKTDEKAYVIPAFEIFSHSNLPENKAHLLKEWNDGRVRPFYSTVCWKCQKQTDFEKWRRGADDRNTPDTYHVTWRDPWEPFYAIQSQLVHYDERFEQYGFNRISQLCDLHLRGVDFYVLYNAFLLHIGFKDPNAFHSKKDEENRRNRILYSQFKKEKKASVKNGRRC